ncbi:ribonuclease H-like domain-containing protein [Tanacetum coccineum]|uniref:Ribonuclease H-like domain-containing protein n=1 Tax=Tanacetum coccineum TaxID=301880 RepID=A0ABQ5GIT7_9ASTR
MIIILWDDNCHGDPNGNFGVNTTGGTNSSSQVSSTPGADEVVAMLTVRVQRFIQKIGRNLVFKGKQPVTFDKSKVKCYNCHRKGHFAKECKLGRNQGKRSYGDNGRRNATTNKPSSQALVAQDGLAGYDWSNDFDEPVNYALMAISSSSSSSSSVNEVQNYSKQCLESFKTLQKNFDSKREKHSRAKLEIQGYKLALESLESRILGHEKNELAWGEKYEFQNYELKCREIKINNLKMELEKVVKERDELKVKIEKWEESLKGLHKILNSQMSAKDKNGKTNEVNIEKPKSVHESVVPKPKINRDKVIIEDWYSDDEDDVSEPDLSPRPLPTIPILDSIPEGSSGNHGGQSSSDRSLSGNEDGLTLQSVYDLCVSLCKQVTDQAKEIKHLKAQIKKLKKKAKPVITHHKAWMKSVSMKQRLAGKKSLKKKWMQKESVSKQGRKPAKFLYLQTEDLKRGEDKRCGCLKKGQSEKRELVTEDQIDPRVTSTRSVLTLKPLPKIDPKDKGKKVLEEEAESDAESEGVDEAERKFDQLAKDEEIARKVQEDWEAEEEMKKLAEEEATKAALIQDFDDIQARIEADRLLAARLQEEERETFTVEERAKFLYDTIAAQRRFLAQQRAAAIRSRPPTRTQLRNQMMTYLKHVGGKKHADLKNKNFEEIQVLYKKVKRFDKDFIAIGSAKDERQIKEMNEESKDPKKKRVVNETPREEDTAKVPAEQEVTEQGTKKRKSGHVKMIARKRPRPQPDDDSDDEHRKCLRIDLFHLYDLVMKQYSKITPEGIELILWGDLKIMMESSTEENDQGDFWNNQQDWEIVSWRLYEACGVCILELKDGTVIYMLVERRYPLSKELLQRMLDLGLEVEEESTAALHLVRFIKQQLNEE